LQTIGDLLPLLLRFLSDEYDDTSMAVFPFLAELLSQVISQVSPFTNSSPVDPSRKQEASFLTAISYVHFYRRFSRNCDMMMIRSLQRLMTAMKKLSFRPFGND